MAEVAAEAPPPRAYVKQTEAERKIPYLRAEIQNKLKIPNPNNGKRDVGAALEEALVRLWEYDAVMGKRTVGLIPTKLRTHGRFVE